MHDTAPWATDPLRSAIALERAREAAAAVGGKHRAAAIHDLFVTSTRHPLGVALMRLARATSRTFYLPRLGYVVSDAAAARQILLDTTSFTKSGRGSAGSIWNQLLGGPSLTGMEGPSHQRLRSVVTSAMNRTYLRQLEEEVVHPLAEQLRERLSSGGAADLVVFAQDLSSRAAYHVIGVPDPGWEARARVFVLARELFRGIGATTTTLSEEHRSRAGAVVRQLADPIRVNTASARAGGVLDCLRHADLADREVAGLVALLLLNGTGTLVAAFPRIAALLIDSGQLSRVQDDTRLATRAVDEGLRLVAPSAVILRAVAKDTPVGDTCFRAGRRVIVVVPPIAQRASGGNVDIGHEAARETNRIWFGAGPHYCLGAEVAQLELEVAVKALAQAGGIRVLSRRYRSHDLLAGYSQLIVGRGPLASVSRQHRSRGVDWDP